MNDKNATASVRPGSIYVSAPAYSYDTKNYACVDGC